MKFRGRVLHFKLETAFLIFSFQNVYRILESLSTVVLCECCNLFFDLAFQ